MQRNLEALSNETFDILIVGGGAFGAALARDAAQRGLRTALVEKGDFGSGASGNSFRVVHGGIRYLQHLDLARVRHSARERAILLATAPHLVRPLPIVMPTRGRGRRSRTLLRAGFLLYDLLTADRNRSGTDPACRIPNCSMLSTERVTELFPGLPAVGLTGGGLFYDAQMQHPARLVLAMLRSAHDDGAVLANYAEVDELILSGSRVVGARVVDREGTGESLEVRAQVVVVAAGAWTDALLGRKAALGSPAHASFSRDLCLLTDLPAEHGYALAVPGVHHDPDAVLTRSARHLFVVPWLGRLIVGVWHRVYEPRPDELVIGEEEMEGFVQEADSAFPGMGLTRERVVAHNTGLVLMEGFLEPGDAPRFGKRSRLVDHRREGLSGLLSLIGVRYTTARYDAARTLDLAAAQLPKRTAPCRTDRTALPGSTFESLAGLHEKVSRASPHLPAPIVDGLCRRHGSAWEAVMAQSTAAELNSPLPGSGVLGAEVVHAVRNEMALHLDDVAMRRTELAAHGCPPSAALEAALHLMAGEFGWDEERKREELQRVRNAATGPARLIPGASV